MGLKDNNYTEIPPPYTPPPPYNDITGNTSAQTTTPIYPYYYNDNTYRDQETSLLQPASGSVNQTYTPIEITPHIKTGIVVRQPSVDFREICAHCGAGLCVLIIIGILLGIGAGIIYGLVINDWLLMKYWNHEICDITDNHVRNIGIEFYIEIYHCYDNITCSWDTVPQEGYFTQDQALEHANSTLAPGSWTGCWHNTKYNKLVLYKDQAQTKAEDARLDSIGIGIALGFYMLIIWAIFCGICNALRGG